jgi:hypothetical protein
MHVVSKESKRLVLPRPSCFIYCLFKGVVVSNSGNIEPGGRAIDEY